MRSPRVPCGWGGVRSPLARGDVLGEAAQAVELLLGVGHGSRYAVDHRAAVVDPVLEHRARQDEVVLPIPETASLAHLEENFAATDLRLTDSKRQRLDRTAVAA